DQHQLEVPHARAAVALGHHGPQPTHLRDALPEVPVVALVRLEHGATDAQVGMLGQVVARSLLDELLVFGEIEIHAGGSFDRSVNRSETIAWGVRSHGARLPADGRAGLPRPPRGRRRRPASGGGRLPARAAAARPCPPGLFLARGGPPPPPALPPPAPAP